MQELVYALNDIKRDLNVLVQKLSAVDRVIRTGDVSQLMKPIQGIQRKRNRKGGQPVTPFVGGQFGQQYGQPTQVFGQPQTGSIPGLWGSSPTNGSSRRNRKKNRQQNVFGFGIQPGGQIPAHIAQQAQLTAQYLQQMLSNTGQKLQTSD